MHTDVPSPGSTALIGFAAQLFNLKAPEGHLPTCPILIEVAHVDERNMRFQHISRTMHVYLGKGYVLVGVAFYVKPSGMQVRTSCVLLSPHSN